MNPTDLLRNYDYQNLTIAALGGHSALEVCHGAKRQGFRTLVIAKRGRERTYTQYLKFVSATQTGCVDEVILVEEFTDILKPEFQQNLRQLNALIVHSRYFWVYFPDFRQVEQDFAVPIIGSREFLRFEERDQKPNQYDILRQAGIRLPRIFKNPKEIDCLTLTKIPSKARKYERANFFARTAEEWQKVTQQKLAAAEIEQADLNKAVIEEFILGTPVNFNFFYSGLQKRLELLGTDTRRQTNLDGVLRLPAQTMLQLGADFQPFHIETGHLPATVKESLLEKAFVAGEKFIATCQQFHQRGFTGPFALQGAIETNGKEEELVIFDVSFRMPGSPGILATPYSRYLFGRPVSLGERIAMEVKLAVQKNSLAEIVS